MPVPTFDESTKAEKLPVEVFRWLREAVMYCRSTPNSAGEVYDNLKLLLRLLAVRNPDSQSHATRQALGSLIECIYTQPNNDKIILDLLALLIRMVGSKQSHRFNAMKHLAIAGLGYLSRYLRVHMRQMSANVFIICLDSLKICPKGYETHRYRNTLLWSLEQSAATTVDEASIRSAFKIAENVIHSDDTDEIVVEGVRRAFDLLAAIAVLPGAKRYEKKLDSLHNLFLSRGISSPFESVRVASSHFYAAVLGELSPHGLKNDLTAIAVAMVKLRASKKYGSDVVVAHKLHGYTLLIEALLDRLVDLDDFESEIEEWIAPLMLQFKPATSKRLLIDGLFCKMLGGSRANVDIVGVLLRQLAHSRTPLNQRAVTSKSKSAKTLTPLTESTLACLTDTLTILGNSIQTSSAAIHQATLGLILNGTEPLTTEQLGWCILCLQAVVRSAPTLLISTIESGLKQMEIQSATSRRVEVAYVVGAMVAISNSFSLYGDVNLTNRVILLAVDYIKRRENLGFYQAGWALLYGSLYLGPLTVKPLVSQLLLLWEVQLSDEACKYPEYLERALLGLVVFLHHNHALLTGDVVGRIGDMLYRLWSCIEPMPLQPLLRRRLLQCYEMLMDIDKNVKCPSSLLMRYVAHFSVPEQYTKEYGVKIESAIDYSKNKPKEKTPVNTSVKEFSMDLALQPTLGEESGMCSVRGDSRGAIENDIDLVIFCSDAYMVGQDWLRTLPKDAYTSIVDSAISFTSKLLPVQPLSIQESVFDAILSNVNNAANQHTLRQFAVTFNIATFIHSTVQHGFSSDGRALNVVLMIIKALLANQSEEIRELAAKSCGVIAAMFRNDTEGSAVLASLIKNLLEFSVSGTCATPLRAGSISALGYIAQERTQYELLDAIFKVFMQLAADPDPTIHTTSIASMRRSINTTAFVDSKYVKYTLKTLTLTYMLESHNNGLVFQREVAEGLVLILSRLGPILSTEQQNTNRELLVCFADHLQDERNSGIRVLAWKCFIELYYYARQGISWPLLIKRWRDIIIDPHSLDSEIDAAINGLLVLVKLSARSIISVAGNGFEDALWLLLDRKPRHAELRALFLTWIEQTSDDDSSVSKWSKSLANVVMKPRFFFADRLHSSIKRSKQESGLDFNEKQPTINPTAVAADEDVALEVQVEDSRNEPFSWEARSFALALLLHLLRKNLHGKTNDEKRFNIMTRVIGDIIKVSFSSSTSQVLGLQFSGLTLLNEIIVQLSDLTDPDFPQISFLAQYQVQIVSALVPAFGHDSSPGLALAALHTCSTFITSNIIKTKEKLGRLLKILESSLESMTTNEFKLGKLEMSADAARVLKIAILAVWARILNDGCLKEHLQEIIAPHKDTLKDYWTEAVLDYARINSTLDSQWTVPSFASSVAQARDVQIQSLLTPVFQLTWLNFVQALSLVETEDLGFRLVLCGLCFQALLKLLTNTGAGQRQHQQQQQQQQQQQNHTLGSGLAVSETESFLELDDKTALRTSSSGAAPVASPVQSQLQAYLLGAEEASPAAVKLSILHVLTRILTPSTCQQLMLVGDEYFDEIVPILYRAMLVGQPEEQAAVLEIAHALVTGQPETDDSVDHFFGVLRVAILPLRKMFPSLFDKPETEADTRISKLSHEQMSLLRKTIDTVIDIAQVFREVIQNDLWICLLKVFEELNRFEPVVIAPSFKRLLEILAAQVEIRGITFVMGALTASLQRAVEKESIVESLLIATAILCTNSRSLNGPNALHQIQRFGTRAGEALIRGTYDDASETDQSVALTAAQCATAIFRVCSETPTGAVFAYAILPYFIMVISNTGFARSSEFGAKIAKHSATAIFVFAAFDGTPETLSLVIPALISSHDESMRGLLLQLVTKHPAPFRHCVWNMDPQDKEALQNMLSQSSPEESNSSVSEEESEDEGNKIQLKSFA